MAVPHLGMYYRHKLASAMEVAEVRASAELELQARLLEAAQQEVARREAALGQREAALMEQERAAREAAAAARQQQQHESFHLAEAESQARAAQQQLQQVRLRLAPLNPCAVCFHRLGDMAWLMGRPGDPLQHFDGCVVCVGLLIMLWVTTKAPSVNTTVPHHSNWSKHAPSYLSLHPSVLPWMHGSGGWRRDRLSWRSSRLQLLIRCRMHGMQPLLRWQSVTG